MTSPKPIENKFKIFCVLLCIVSCTSTKRSPQSLEECTKAKVGDYNAPLNGVGPEFLEKLNRAIEECEDSHDTK